MPKLVRITICIDPVLAQLLTDRKRDSGESVSQLCQQLILRGLSDECDDRPRLPAGWKIEG